MNIPSIPGYLEQPEELSLADLWNRPGGNYPAELWPAATLRDVRQTPSGWLVVEQYSDNDDRHIAIGCVLVRRADQDLVLDESSWSGRSLGTASVWSDGRFDDGQRVVEQGAELSFFVQIRHPVGAKTTAVEISQPFLWYWDAYIVDGGARYLSAGGREHDLLRWTTDMKSWRIEVRALEFRQFLTAANFTAVVQVDAKTKIEADEFERVDDEFRNNWSHFTYFALHDSIFDSRPAFSGTMGKYLIEGVSGAQVPRWEEHDLEREYPQFVYGQDNQTGELKLHTCDPRKLGNYSDGDGSRLHYLTPVYFKKEVLFPYTSQPGRYRVTASRLACLNLWAVDLGVNSAGLIEVYLGE